METNENCSKYAKMPEKVNDRAILIARINKVQRNTADMFSTIERLLENYPQFKFHEGNANRFIIWRDHLKPFMTKIADDMMDFDEDGFMEVYHQELERLLLARNHMKHIVTVISAKKNKKVIFQVMGELMNDSYVLGSEPSPKTQRIIDMYEQEGRRKHISIMFCKSHIENHIFRRCAGEEKEVFV